MDPGKRDSDILPKVGLNDLYVAEDAATAKAELNRALRAILVVDATIMSWQTHHPGALRYPSMRDEYSNLIIWEERVHLSSFVQVKDTPGTCLREFHRSVHIANLLLELFRSEPACRKN